MIKLTASSGETFIIDREDYDKIKDLKWTSYSSYRKSKKYLRSHTFKNGVNKTHLLHRIVTDAPKGMEVDHINGDTFDNRKANLRVCTHAENVRNSKPNNRNTSGYKGVRFYKRNKKWGAAIRSNEKRLFLGLHSTKEDAARAYNLAAIKYFGDYAWLNKV